MFARPEPFGLFHHLNWLVLCNTYSLPVIVRLWLSDTHTHTHTGRCVFSGVSKWSLMHISCKIYKKNLGKKFNSLMNRLTFFRRFSKRNNRVGIKKTMKKIYQILFEPATKVKWSSPSRRVWTKTASHVSKRLNMKVDMTTTTKKWWMRLQNISWIWLLA